MNQHQHQQAPTRPIVVRGNDPTHVIEIGLGRDVSVTFRGPRLVLLEVNGLQYAPISTHRDQDQEWFKSLVKGGLDPILKDAPVIDRMVMDYLFDAAVKTRLGESQ